MSIEFNRPITGSGILREIDRIGDSRGSSGNAVDPSGAAPLASGLGLSLFGNQMHIVKIDAGRKRECIGKVDFQDQIGAWC